MSFKRAESGNVAIVFALALTALVGAIGVAVDFGRAQLMETRMQRALDAAVLAGAAADPADQIRIASATFTNNLSFTQATGLATSFGSAAGGRFDGTVSAKLGTTFMALLGYTEMTRVVHASARLGTATATTSVCVLLKDPSAAQALLVNGGADVLGPNCEIHVASNGSPAAVFNAGTALNVARTCIAGASVLDNGGVHPNLAKSCTVAADPFAGALPVPASATCTASNGNFTGGTVNLTPGVYCGFFNFNAAPTVNFAPGLYVIRGGDWNVDGGTWSGNGVTFYFADSSRIQFNSAVAANLTAPVGGAYDGIMMFEADGLSRSPFVVDDSLGFKADGLFYLPSRDLTFNRGSSLTNKKMTLVGNTLILDQTHWTLDGASRTIPLSSGGGTPYLVN